MTGGGTGGHITPLLAVAQKLKAAHPGVEIIYIGERGSKFADLTHGSELLDAQYQIFAGKFRRYHGESWLRRLLDVQTLALNVRDLCSFAIGTVQSYVLLGKIKPDVILLKGGFVGVPVGLAAAVRHLPFVTHDSDALPGLANRLVSRWAVGHATGMPAEYYAYPSQSVRHVGVLVGELFIEVTPLLQKQYRSELQLPADAQVLTVTGGSLGAQRLNQALVRVAPKLLESFPRLHIIHQVGKGKQAVYGGYKHERLQVLEFLHGMHRYTGAADVVITRAGANTLAELGVQAKACVVVPNPLLTGGHQLKNAEHLAAEGAVVVVDEQSLTAEQGRALYTAVASLLQDAARRQQLGQKLHAITIPNAAEKLAELLVQLAEQGSSKD